jgi:3-dehydroquinate synthase
LGGGVIGDITGFIAATFLRGIPFIQIPTTLLAQVDSSVGGKTGVNLPAGKNLVGAFYQPGIVLIDPSVLTTLAPREFISGMAEVIKYALIRDAAFFDRLNHSMPAALQRDPAVLRDIIARCCGIKAAITTQDETEQNLRALLNFGHTVGHALETITDYRRYTHGEAVAIGMHAAACMSCAWGLCGREVVPRIAELLDAAGLPCALPPCDIKALTDVMLRDKKKSGESLRFVALSAVGKALLHDVNPAQLASALACARESTSSGAG